MQEQGGENALLSVATDTKFYPVSRMEILKKAVFIMNQLCKFENAVKSVILRECGEDFLTVTYLDYVYGIFVIADDCVQDIFIYDSDTDTTAFIAEFGYSCHYEVHEFIYELVKHRVPFNSEHFLKSEYEIPF